MKILSIGGDGHDISFTVLEDGVPIHNIEKERHTRIKGDRGSSSRFALSICKDIDSCDVLVADAKLKGASKKALENLVKRIGPVHSVGHHTAHAAHGFYSSTFDEALIFTLDGGGWQTITSENRQTMADPPEKDILTTAATVWTGKGTKIQARHVYGLNEINIGWWWDIVTTSLGFSTTPPGGNQAGTVMAMAAMGNPERFRFKDFRKSIPDSENFRLELSRAVKENGEQAHFDAAASLQAHTERFLRPFIESWLDKHSNKNLCFSGGCALNSVFMGKMLDWFPDYNLYVCPVPYDGGLSIGGAQYVWHHVLNNPRISWKDNVSPYLGYQYSREAVLKALEANK